MYDGNIVLLAFFLGMFFGLYAEQVIRSVVYAVVSFVMGLPTKHAPDAVPPQEAGDLTPADVHEKMARLPKPRRR